MFSATENQTLMKSLVEIFRSMKRGHCDVSKTQLSRLIDDPVIPNLFRMIFYIDHGLNFKKIFATDVDAIVAAHDLDGDTESESEEQQQDDDQESREDEISDEKKVNFEEDEEDVNHKRKVRAPFKTSHSLDDVEALIGGCQVCGTDEAPDTILLCDLCNQEFHMHCLDPPLVQIPEGEWFCPDCRPKPKASKKRKLISKGSKTKRNKN